MKRVERTQVYRKEWMEVTRKRGGVTLIANKDEKTRKNALLYFKTEAHHVAMINEIHRCILVT
jgi:hypothetical protein